MTTVDREFAKDETDRLIASNKVNGTAVYNPSGDRMGSIYNFMVDKRTGKVEYAVFQFGGILGIGADYYPLPWKILTYDENQDGYVVDIDRDRLERAPRYSGADPRFDRAYGEEVHGYYGVPYI